MRYAVILAGGSGTRLWPLSTRDVPKQVAPLFAEGSLLKQAVDRLRSMFAPEALFLCAQASQREAMLAHLQDFPAAQFIAEPEGRDTLSAVALVTAVLARRDPQATVGIFTADQVIEPRETFAAAVQHGYDVAETIPHSLVTFGITPTFAATGYGYLELGDAVDGDPSALRVRRFTEKPDAPKAQRFFEAGAGAYLWNAGMFVWRADVLLDCVKRFAPVHFELIREIVDHWDLPQRDQTLAQVYPRLPRISVDHAVMEPASQDEQIQILAVPMAVRWLDVGSWPAYHSIMNHDARGNAAVGGPVTLEHCQKTLVLNRQDDHLVALLGCEDLIVVHTANATLVCKADQAQDIRALHQQIEKTHGPDWL